MNKKVKSFLRPYWRFLKNLVKSSKKVLIKPIQHLPVSSESIGPPKGFHESTQQWAGKLGENYYIEIYPSHLISRTEPGRLNEDVHWKFKLEYTRQIPTSFVAVVPNGRVWVNKGKIVDYNATIAEDDRVLTDLSLDFGNLPNNHSIFSEWRLGSVHRVKGTAAALTSAKANIYFHWMTDLLPRIELLRRSGIDLTSIDKFIVNSYSSPFQQETLTALGISSDKIIESSKYPHIKTETLLASSLPTLPGNPPAWVCEFLRKEFLPLACTPQTSVSEALAANNEIESLDKVKRIYISRANASYRRIINEVEVASFLEALGFNVLVLELMIVAEQAALFHAANVVVAPHGAGLTNIVFCQPGTKVIEFFSPLYVNVCYWSLANQVGLDYYYILGKGKKPPEGVDLHLVGEDILVNLDELYSTLKLAGVC